MVAAKKTSVTSVTANKTAAKTKSKTVSLGLAQSAPIGQSAAAKKTAARVQTVSAGLDMPVKTEHVKEQVPAKPKVRRVDKKNPVVSAEQRANYIEVAAFFIAQQRGFAPGKLMDDWLAAEAEVDRLIITGQLGC